MGLKGGRNGRSEKIPLRNVKGKDRCEIMVKVKGIVGQ